ncbi:hypothetical protein ACJ73_06138 [Blastomyces percursus]|uniref:Uncharacterized protein n=1 Tax=Blastomyces percursus TaxID=1658174 RepID=A0A1J9Q1R7_9EURO|nr:hypothetical protein ACJ73_06138 [Blastomyces percursus]
MVKNQIEVAKSRRWKRQWRLWSGLWLPAGIRTPLRLGLTLKIAKFGRHWSITYLTSIRAHFPTSSKFFPRSHLIYTQHNGLPPQNPHHHHQSSMESIVNFSVQSPLGAQQCDEAKGGFYSIVEKFKA